MPYDMMKKAAVFLLLALALVMAAAMPVGAAVDTDYNYENRGNLLDTVYNSMNGMPTSEANDIIQGRDGFIWIACYSGLVRYDGVCFQRIANPGLTSVVSLYCDSKGRMWAATNDHGVMVCGTDGEYTGYNKADGLQSSSVRAIAEYSDGSIILGTTGGLNIIGADGTVRTVDAPVNIQHTGCMASYGDNKLVGVSDDGSIFLIQGDKLASSVFCGNTYPTPSCVSVDGDGKFWFGTDINCVLTGTISNGGEFRYEKINTGSLSTVNRIIFAGKRAWICSDTGVGYIEDGVCHEVPTSMNNSVDSLCTDSEGNLWFASSRQGVMRLTENNFSDVSKAMGLPDMVTNTSLLTEDYLYIGTDNGLFIADRSDPDYTTEINNELTEMLEGVRVRCAMEASDKKVWFATYSGVVSCDKDGKITVINANSGLPTKKTRSVTELSDGRIAVGTSSGLCIISEGRVTEVYDEKSGLGNADILAVCQGPDGELMLGTDGGGAFVLKDGEFSVPFTGENELVSDVVMRIRYDKLCGGYWLVTGSNLAFYDGEKLINLDNFPYFNNYDLYFKDDTPTLWVLGSGGIYIVDRTELLSGGEVSYQSFKHADGLMSDITANSFSCLGDDDVLYICSSTGTLAVAWNRDGRASVPQVTVPCVYADGKRIDVKDGAVRIPAKTSHLTIDGYALTYTLQDPTVRYQLDGVDEEPITSLRSELGEIRYTNLRGGEYTFTISVVEPISGEIITEKSVRIVKPKLFYETVWFYVAIAAAAAALIGAVIAIYSYRKIKIANARSESAHHLTNEIISTFSKVIDAKDKYTNGHSQRVAQYAAAIAEKLGTDPDRVQEIYNIALLHDIGKLGIPDDILNKHGPLTDDEYVIMKTHTTMGSEILSDIDVLPEIELGAKYHHERYDGKGYVYGLSGENIPLISRIIAVADAFDAMNSTRVYRKNMPAEKILSEIKKGSGGQFDPKIVDAFLELVDEKKIVLDESDEVK